MSEATRKVPTFRALLIGCDFYFPNRLPSGATYESLGGCVRDIDRIAEVLRGRIVGPLAITRLAASRGDGRPSEPESEWPTAANLRAALDALIDTARAGDQVYIGYSGHGGRAVTAYRELKGVGARDEALVPIDIGGGPGIVAKRYLRDVELAGFIARLASKIGAGAGGGALTLSFDCCHSAGTVRGPAAIAQRCATGGDTLDTTPPDDASDHAAVSEARSAWTALERAARSLRGARPGTSWLPPSGSYVLLAACRDTESAIETRAANQIDGQLGGVMTDAFLEALSSLTGRPSWVTVYNRVRAQVEARFPSQAQTPQLLGDTMREVFGAEFRPIPPSAPVLEVDAGGRRVRVGAGLATLVGPGVELGIFRPDTLDFSLDKALVASATVTDAQAAECWAALDPTSDPGQIELGAPAVVRKVARQRTVALFRRTDLPPAIADHQDAALSAVAAAITSSGRGFVVEAAPGTTPDYQVVANERGEYEIWDARGSALPYMTPALRAVPVDAALGGSAARVVDRLLQLCRYRSVLELASPASDLDDSVDVDLLGGPAGWPADGSIPAPQQLSSLASEGDVHPVKHRQVIFLRITNRGSRAINVAAVDLSCTWGIHLLVPADETGASAEVVGDHETRWFPIIMFVPPGLGTTLDVIKVFATLGNAPFSSLKQPSIDQAFSARGTQREVIPGELERSFDLGWTVRTFRLRVT